MKPCHETECAVLPAPQEIELTGERFPIDSRTVVVTPAGCRDALAAATYLANGIADATRVGVPVVTGEAPAGRNAILVLSASEGGRAAAAAQRLGVSRRSPGPEGYALEATARAVAIVGSDGAGALYGAATALELLRSRDLEFWIEGARVRDWPYKPVRGVHVFMPGKEHLPYFMRYLERFLVRHKFNTMILEVGGGMRLRSHPEVSAGWARTVEELYAHGEVVWKYRESCPLGPRNRFQDTTHRGVGYGEYIEPEELAALCGRARSLNVNVIPEIQSLSHVYHLVCPRRDVAEIPKALFPDAYCPCNEESYRLIFDVIDEYADVMGCGSVHIGHDEWRAAGLCPKCRKRRTGDLFARDVVRLWRHLDAKGRDLWMWGDHFVTKHNERPRSVGSPGRGVWYDFPSTEGARGKVSKATRSRPITITNWSWSMGEETDEQLHAAGFKVVYGNFHGRKFHPDWPRRSAKPWILGAEVSSWCAADEYELGKLHVASAAYGIGLLWSSRWPEPDGLQRAVLERLPAMKSRLAARPIASISSPSARRLVTLDIGRACNSPLKGEKWDLSPLAGASGMAGCVPYAFRSGRKACVVVRRPEDSSSKHPREAGIPVNACFEGLVFWHATTGGGGRTIHAGDQTHFPRESSDLVAVYEVFFADGRIDTVECRWRENIDNWNASLDAADYHAPHHIIAGSLADGRPMVICGHEWHNPRTDIVVRSITMKGCARRACEPKAPLSATVLLGISGIEKPRLSDYRGSRA